MKKFVNEHFSYIVKVLLIVIGVTLCFVGRAVNADLTGVLMMVWGLIMTGLGLQIKIDDSERRGE